MMHITSTNYTVADYCQAMERKEIQVNRDYQRSARVWPPISRSFLIETILLNYPIPKLSLFQVTDIKSRKTYKEIVDGQQRSRAVLDFYNDRFRLSRSSEIGEVAGKLYSELDEEYQHRFLDYSLSADLFVSATPAEIREVFRRINSYTVPLNPEEKRHSIYQGEFKWFIYELSKTYDQNFIDIGLFGQKQLIRMADAKLFTEIIHAFLHGITKTDARKLDNLYKSHERDFSKKAELEKRIDRAINFVLSLEEIHQSPLVKPYNFYSLILAVSHIMNPVDGFKSIYEPPIPNLLDRNFVLSNFTKLAEALENPDAFGDKAFKEFVLATLSDTNGQQNRQTRFKWFCKALEPKLL
jgi:hypothetical protein